MSGIIFQFEKLTVWQKAKKLVKEVFILLQSFPNEERYGLKSQISRSIISVPSNIAEGNGRSSSKDKSHFIEIAYGSLGESYTQLLIACDLGYISENDLEEIKPLFREISASLSSIRRKLKSKDNTCD